MDTYIDVVEKFEWQRPESYNFVREVIDRWAENSAQEAIFWVDDHGNERRISYKQLSDRSKQLCNVLTQSGIQRGDTLVLVLGRQIPWWETVTACIRMGVIVSPGTTQLSGKDLVYRINTSGARAIITDLSGADKLGVLQDQCPALSAKLCVDGDSDGWVNYEAEVGVATAEFETVDTASDEDALCYFTSGTTGRPKMTVHSHSYGLGHETTGRFWLDLSPTDLHWNISDTGWAKAAWSSYFGPFFCGASLFVHDAAAFSPQRTLDLLGQYPVTTMCGAPTIYRMLVLQDLAQYSFPSLRHSVGAGEPLNPEVIETWKKHTGITIRDGYGQTETTILCANFLSFEPRFGSMGKPAPGIELQVIDEQGQILPIDTEGDIAVKVKPMPPQGFFKGYKDQPDLTVATFRGDWYLTGDRAKVDEDGFFWFVSRADDVIISAGYRIGPFEVESALIEHPAVAESAVVSSPDESRGEVVKAFIVLAPGFSADDDMVNTLQNHMKSVTAPYKYPRKIEFVSALPKTVSGKIRRIELREREWGQST